MSVTESFARSSIKTDSPGTYKKKKINTEKSFDGLFDSFILE